MAIDSLFILNTSGKPVIEKHWCEEASVRKDTTLTLPAFLRYLEGFDTIKEAEPIWYYPPSSTVCVHIQRNDLVYLCTMSSDVGPLQVLDFLDHLVENATEYIGNVTEVTLKENFIIIYELLSEMMDSGSPITTDISLLKNLVPPPNFVNRVIENVTGIGLDSDASPQVNVSSIPWRSSGIKYTRNEFYVDMVETIDAILESNGRIVSCNVSGSIICDCRLSGMPDLRMSFNQPSLLDNLSFHPCIRIPRWESEKSLSFVPPDRKFKLATYSIDSGVIQNGIPLHMSGRASFESNTCNLQLTVMANQQMVLKSSGAASTGALGGNLGSLGGPRKKALEDVKIELPLPTTAYNIRIQTKKGAYSVDQSKSDQTKLTWQLKTLGLNDNSVDLYVQFSLKDSTSSTIKSDASSRPALSAFAQFKLTGVSASSVKINSLKMIRETYNINKGVKTITQAGTFQMRF
ncbi:AP-3 complex subunit mu-2 [Mycoemilia scoparia]|uniref:AP-3 complex subunit mu-2 n=1 Tax=Mycoemilia scoparia TaxID=417184 RepID=A0A9W8A1J9_9FUNG|nr:AP-3 complex subunit mu-2 [Mycoemilia scoparia]